MNHPDSKKNEGFDYCRALDLEELKRFVNRPEVARVISVYPQGSTHIAWVELKAEPKEVEPKKAEPTTKKNSPKEK